MIVSCHECGQPVEYRSSWGDPAKEFNTVDLAGLRREFRDRIRWSDLNS